MILDRYGNALTSASTPKNLINRVAALAQQNRSLRAKFDAAQTTLANEGHWSNADNFDPHTTASLHVRQKLRSRSRYEILENNPYLKGTVLTIANDFVGSGPKLKITDKRIPGPVARLMELRWNKYYVKKIKLRQKLWRMRIAKIVDGETIGKMYLDPRLSHPVQLNLRIYETDQITSAEFNPDPDQRYNEIDGIRFTDFEDVLSYHILRYHPGGSIMNRIFAVQEMGDWIKAKWIIHWFRKDRGWLRGIPETTPSLPLCSILRRYTLAALRHAELQADLTGVIETEGPPSAELWDPDSADDPFDSFPIDAGMIVNLPWGYKFKQVDSVPNGTEYDAFVGCMLREITRPLLSPYNLTIGSSADATMSSAVVDTHIYKESQDFERLHCNEDVLDPLFDTWFKMGMLTEDYFDEAIVSGANYLQANPTLRLESPLHEWNWDRIGLDHTDPQKVAQALQVMRDSKFMTDRDVQEGYFNRDIETWREEVKEDDEFRESLPSTKADREAAKKPDPAKPAAKPASKKPAPKRKPAKARSPRRALANKRRRIQKAAP